METKVEEQATFVDTVKLALAVLILLAGLVGYYYFATSAVLLRAFGVIVAVAAGLGVVFIRSMTAISATIFLISIHWTLITVRILENMTELSLGPAAAFSVFVIVVVFVVVAALSAVLARLRAPTAGAAARSFLGG